jgi:hypothetical protein
LVKVCRLFSSPLAGERAAAALRAHEMLRIRGLQWEQVLAAPAAEARPGGHFADVDVVLANADRLTEWEQNFAKNLRFWRRTLSEKQLVVLRRLVEKVTAER